MLRHLAASSPFSLLASRSARISSGRDRFIAHRSALALPLLFLLGSPPTSLAFCAARSAAVSAPHYLCTIGGLANRDGGRSSSSTNDRNMPFGFQARGVSNPNSPSPTTAKGGVLSGIANDYGRDSDRRRRQSSLSASSRGPNPTRWSDAANDALRRCVPPLSYSSHKGSSGRIGVLGGSKRYTGAPYYAAISALKVGADLAFVFCAEEAATPIKCYSPELMVAGVYSAAEFDASVEEWEEAKRRREDGEEGMGEEAERILKEQDRLIDKMVSEVTSLFDRMHVLIVGPGLGRCPLVLRAAARVINAAREASLPLVIDADGLYLLTLEEHADLVAGYRGLVLTPNAVEVKRLAQSLGANYAKLHPDKDIGDMDGEELTLTAFDRATEGNVIVKKGRHDILFSVSMDTEGGRMTVSRGSMLCEEEGGLKRSGGIGDILSGTIGTFVAWNKILSGERGGDHNDNDSTGVAFGREDLLLACWSACCVTKRATKAAYRKKKRAMTAPDVLEEIGQAVDDMTGEATEEDS